MKSDDIVFAEFIERVKEEKALAEKSPERKRQYIKDVSTTRSAGGNPYNGRI
jgi:hypothetical protein